MKRSAFSLHAAFCALALAALAGAAAAQTASGNPPLPRSVKAVAFRVENRAKLARPNEPVVLRIADIRKAAPDFDPAAFHVSVGKDSARRQVASQADDLDGDGVMDEIAFVVDIPAAARLDGRITYGPAAEIAGTKVLFPKRAHASFQRKYEGLGWESDRVAWRMYFDERNAFDMYGKRQHVLLLDYFALPGVDYHAESPLGRDTYKIGQALGIGSLGAYVDGKPVKVSKVDSREWKVIADGPVRAIADLMYKGWDVAGRKVDITSRLTVWAGQHWFDHAVSSPNAGDLTLVTSLPVKPKADVSFLSDTAGNAGVRYIATWGKQVLMPGATASEALPDLNMGLAVIPAGRATSAGLSSDTDYLVRVPRGARGYTFDASRWRVVSAWDQEAPDGDSVSGIKPALQLPYAVGSEAAWRNYVDAQTTLHESPVVVSISRSSRNGA